MRSLFLLTCLSAVPAMAQSPIAVPINYDALSFIEEPLAVDIGGGVTVSTNGLVDQSLDLHIIDANDPDSIEESFNTRAIASIKASTQLSNSWDVSAEYVANYNRLRGDEYQDNMAFTVSDEWGTFSVGNVSETVREMTRRTRGVGNAALSYDDFVGRLDQDALLYTVRHNMVQLAAVVDGQGNAEAAISYAEPIGESQYRTALRFRHGATENNSGFLQDAETYGVAWVGAYYYASYLLDVQIGYEDIQVHNNTGDHDHLFASLGGQYQFGAYRFSLEGAIGELAGNERRAVSLGAAVDIARGLSFNVGVNYKYENDIEFAEAISSMRYAF